MGCGVRRHRRSALFLHLLANLVVQLLVGTKQLRECGFITGEVSNLLDIDRATCLENLACYPGRVGWVTGNREAIKRSRFPVREHYEALIWRLLARCSVLCGYLVVVSVPLRLGDACLWERLVQLSRY